ncbi:hypothetical protein KY316_02485, partial [Candidatus Woesearchaeota archaeon]|nr:hypothetical protein [Candidatus Woesearchaeota archaeon]
LKLNDNIKHNLKEMWWFICRHYFVFFWVPVYAYMAMIFQVSSIPDPLALPGMHLAVQLFSGWTNSILHFLEYFVLSMILSVA